LNLLSFKFSVRRLGLAFALWIILIQLSSCMEYRIPLKKPAVARQQAQHIAEFRLGKSTRDDVRTALGEPLVQSNFWGFDLFKAVGTSKEIGVAIGFGLPIPMGYYTTQVESYVLVAYDNAGRFAQVASDYHFLSESGENVYSSSYLRARDINFDTYYDYTGNNDRGLILTVDANRLQEYLALVRPPGTCTVIMACDDEPFRKWYSPNTCPSRIAIDISVPLEIDSFFGGSCEQSRSCTPATFNNEGILRHDMMPMVQPFILQPGPHRLLVGDPDFKKRSETSFECSAGEVRYGILKWRSGAPNVSVTFVDELPAGWGSYSFLLYYRFSWLVESEPSRPDGGNFTGSP
jgi:hypothetical protein